MSTRNKRFVRICVIRGKKKLFHQRYIPRNRVSSKTWFNYIIISINRQGFAVFHAIPRYAVTFYAFKYQLASTCKYFYLAIGVIVQVADEPCIVDAIVIGRKRVGYYRRLQHFNINIIPALATATGSNNKRVRNAFLWIRQRSFYGVVVIDQIEVECP